MKKLKVNDNCIGCGACVAIDEKHFDFNENGLSHAISNENLDTDEVKNAIASCPVNAISIVDEENDKCNCENCNCGDNCSCGCEDGNCTCDENCECGCKN